MVALSIVPTMPLSMVVFASYSTVRVAIFYAINSSTDGNMVIYQREVVYIYTQ